MFLPLCLFETAIPQNPQFGRNCIMSFLHACAEQGWQNHIVGQIVPLKMRHPKMKQTVNILVVLWASVLAASTLLLLLTSAILCPSPSQWLTPTNSCLVEKTEAMTEEVLAASQP